MTYLLGQPVVMILKGKLGIVTSFSSASLPRVTYLKDNNTLDEEFCTLRELNPLRIINEDSPTGKSIYYGKLTKKVKQDEHVKLKVEEEKLAQYIVETSKLMDK